MLAILEQARVGCTMADVVEVSQRPEVRQGILDSVQPGCGKEKLHYGNVNSLICVNTVHLDHVIRLL